MALAGVTGASSLKLSGSGARAGSQNSMLVRQLATECSAYSQFTFSDEEIWTEQGDL